MKRETFNKTITLIGIAIVVVISILYFSSKQETEQRNVDSLNLEPKYSTVSEEINYYKNTKGYLSKPTNKAIYPGIIMIHEWWGLNENIKQMADNLAAQGYFVLAVDLYNGNVTTESSEAGKLASSVRNNPEEAIENMRAAISYLKEEHNTQRIASLGWCFGGQQSLQISINEEVDATVIYYGNLVTDKEQLSSIESPILGIFGAEDISIPVETVNKFDSALDELNIENEIYIYEGVGHAFANPSGNNYAPEETLDAWIKTTEFLERNLYQ